MTNRTDLPERRRRISDRKLAQLPAHWAKHIWDDAVAALGVERARQMAKATADALMALAAEGRE